MTRACNAIAMIVPWLSHMLIGSFADTNVP
jgi:hypothetical protein